METVLVTGGGGFLGRYVVEQHLARGDRVRSFSRRAYPELAALGVEQVQGDLQSAEAVRRATAGVDVVQHVAGIAGIWGPWSHYYGVNVLGTEHVVAACRAEGVPRLVYTSSPSVTFGGEHQSGIDESAPYPEKWLCHYPHTKAIAERHVLAANDPPNLMTCALRPHLIWGPRDENLIPRLIARASRGRLRRIGDGTNRVDMIYVANAAEAQLQAADALRPGSPVCGKAYFLSQGEPVNCWGWINEILKSAGIAPVRKSVSLRAALRIGRTFEILYTLLRLRGEPPLTRFLALQLATDHWFDISAARQDFGYRPRISTEEGMRRLAESFGG